MPDDLEVIQHVLDGHRECFRVLVERHERPVWRVVNGLLGPRGDAEDMAQDVFLAAYAKLSSFDPAKASFSTWLLTIARNKCLNMLSRRRPIAVADPPELPDLDTPQRVAAENEWFARLDVALAGLPVDQKTAFVLSEIEGLSLDQIARIEDAPLGTVKSRISRAKQKLRAALHEFEGAEEPR